VFFNLFAAAKPYVSVKSTHGTHAIICNCSGVGEVKVSKFRVSGDQCPQQSQEAENPWVS